MRTALALIRILRVLAPRDVRGRWTEEWRAEIEHAALAMAGERWSGVRVLRFATGAIRDVIGLNRLPRTVTADRGSWLNGMQQDFRHAGRNLRAVPGFAATVVLSLSVGVLAVAGAPMPSSTPRCFRRCPA